MGKTYTSASEEVERTIAEMQRKHHPELQAVRIGALFIFDPEYTDKQVLSHNGYPALAVVKIMNLYQRALGLPDAVITIDRACWLQMKGARCDALIDHELQHLERARDEDTDEPIFDSVGRPSLKMRKHDRQFGWFDEIAQRHGENSVEITQARSLISETNQLYFDFQDEARKQIHKDVRVLLGNGEQPAGDNRSGATDGAAGVPAGDQQQGQQDELLPKAIAEVRSSKRVSISSVQLACGIGYNRAARLLETMETLGIVTARDATGRRELIDQGTAS